MCGRENPRLFSKRKYTSSHQTPHTTNMPRNRIPLNYTIQFKPQTVSDFHAASAQGETRSAFCRRVGVPRFSLQNWQRCEAKLEFAAQRHARVSPTEGPFRSRAHRTTLGGSGRIADTVHIEDALLLFVKDERRLEHTVTMASIVAMAVELAPEVFANKTLTAEMSWCRRFLQRHSLTIRRICHSGRKTRADLEVLRLGFVDEVVETAIAHCLDPRTSLPIPRAVFNMDQTSVYFNMSSRTSIEFVGAPMVRSVTAGGESDRCTMVLTVSADGRMLPPHFVFKGEPDGEVEQEVGLYCDSSIATFSVQSNAWFDERVMLEWVDKVWQHVVVEPSILILDSLRVHKKKEITEALASTGTAVHYVPGGVHWRGAAS